MYSKYIKMERSIKKFLKLFIASAKFKLEGDEMINMNMFDDSDKSNLVMYIYDKFKNVKTDLTHNLNLIITHNDYIYKVEIDKYIIGICKLKYKPNV